MGYASSITVALKVEVPALDGSAVNVHRLTAGRAEWLAMEAEFPGWSVIHLDSPADLTLSHLLYMGWHCAKRAGLTAMSWAEWKQRADADVEFDRDRRTVEAAEPDPTQPAPSPTDSSSWPSPPASPLPTGAPST